MNTDKTTAMVVNPQRKTQSMASQTAGGSIYCQGRQVAIVSCSRVLGVIIDNNLTWSAHDDVVHSKVASKIGALKRSSRQLTRQARRSFFFTVIQPDLEYSAVAYIPNMPEFQKQRLLTLWRKAVRCVAGAERHADVDPVCKKLSLVNFGSFAKVCHGKSFHSGFLLFLEQQGAHEYYSLTKKSGAYYTSFNHQRLTKSPSQTQTMYVNQMA